MPHIKVDTNKINQYAGTVESVRSRVQQIMCDFSSVGMSLDWDVKASSTVNSQIISLAAELNAEASSLSKMKSFLNSASLKYIDMDRGFGEQASKIADPIGAILKYELPLPSMVGAVTDIIVGADAQSAKINGNPLKYLDIGDALSGLADTGLTVYELWKNGFWSSKFNVKQVGDYVHVFGKNKTWKIDGSPLENIKGRRYRIGSEKDVKFGVSAHATNIALTTKFSRALKWQFNDFFEDTFFSKSAKLDYLSISCDIIKNMVGNVKNGASISKIGADAVTDAAKGVGRMVVTSAGTKIGAAIGTIIPVLGTLVGGVVGGVVSGFVYDYLIDGALICGKSIAGWTSYALESAGDAIAAGAKAVGEAAVGAGKAVVNVAKSAGKVIGKAADKVGDAISGLAKGAKNFIGSLF